MAAADRHQDYKLGIADLDEQHSQILRFLDELSGALRCDDRDGIGRVLNELIEHSDAHFYFEEKLMADAGYPALESHRLVHRSFANRLAAHRVKFNAGDDIGRKLMSDLRLWFSDHIMRDDRDFAPFVHKMLSPPRKTGVFSKLKLRSGRG